jgi:hypothetical protein
MWEFRLIELLTYSSPFIDIHLHCLDERKSVFKNFVSTYSYIYTAFGLGWKPHVYDWLGVHITSVTF